MFVLIFAINIADKTVNNKCFYFYIFTLISLTNSMGISIFILILQDTSQMSQKIWVRRGILALQKTQFASSEHRWSRDYWLSAVLRSLHHS